MFKEIRVTIFIIVFLPNCSVMYIEHCLFVDVEANERSLERMLLSQSTRWKLQEIVTYKHMSSESAVSTARAPHCEFTVNLNATMKTQRTTSPVALRHVIVQNVIFQSVVIS